MKILLSDMTSKELEDAIKKNALILLPVGQIEEHGPHLPVGCDAYIGERIAKSVAEKLSSDIPVLTMPVIWSGYSPKVMSKWKGTLRVRTRVVMDLVHDVLASLCEMGFKRIVVIDSHGQHRGILEVAIREIADEYKVYCALTSPFTFSADLYGSIRKTKLGGAAHACEWETSLIMHLGYDIDMSKATDIDKMSYKSEFYEADGIGKKLAFISLWGIQQSKSGCYGDPTVSSKETGKKLFDYIVERYVRFCKEYVSMKLTGD
ncbi:MAG: creatininase family protein [Actinobacteria bacterium]|nr:creatininase family protein [Actinomycetota bacterium]